MYTSCPQYMRLVVLLSLYLVCSASPSYYIVVPSDNICGVNTSFAVHWFGDSDLTLTAGIRTGRSFLSNVTKVIKKDSIEILTLPGIAENCTFNTYDLVVNGSYQKTSVFSQSVRLITQMKNRSIFIQTDKALYKPGETVRIRIIAVNHTLKPNNRDADLIIWDPMANIVQKYLKLKSDMGVISTQFKLANSPMLGNWLIQAISNDEVMDIASFNVAEQVFQKFDVILDVPSFIIDSKMENLTGTVTAKYHYGKPVKGNVTITIMPFIAGAYPDMHKTYEISGSVNFSFQYEKMLPFWGGINITATVYEELTGLAVKTSINVPKENSEYRLNIISQKPVFEQGLTFRAQILVQRIDNKPLTKDEREKNVFVKISQGTGPVASLEIATSSIRLDNVIMQNYTISESGIISLEFTVLESLQWIQVEVAYQTFFQTFYFKKPTIGNPFIQINISETPLKVGTPFHLDVTTYPVAQDIYYVVIAKGTVVAAGKNKTTFSLTPEHSWAPSARLIVYIQTLNSSFGDIIQTTHTLFIKGTLKNQVTLSWNKNSAKPLENVTLSINVKESPSIVALRVVEKSSSPSGDINDLTSSRIDSEFSQNYPSFPMSLTDAFIYDINENVALKLELSETIPSSQIPPEFIETWIWLETNISTSLSTNLQVTVPDKNTTWLATAFVLSEGLGLGVTHEPIELSVVKPLLMTLNMPKILTRGEQFILEVMLFNSLKEDMQVTITLESSSSFDILGTNNNTGFVPGQRNATLPKDNGTVVFFPIWPKVLGNITIIVTATSKAASDTLTRYIVVKAEGIKYYYSESVLFDVRGSAPSTVSKNFLFTFTSDLVQGSEEAFITVVGDLLGPSIKGLESLIIMPYGCGEQNMIVFAPNIYILSYLIATNQINEDIRKQSINFMEQGHQRELLYRHSDGSFSAFGSSDMFGSTWLTAFVFRCFLQARSFIYIDPNVLNEAVSFLAINHNMNTGVFTEPGRVIHRELQGGLNGPITLTAYIVTSMLEEEYYRNLYATIVQKSVRYLEDKYDEGISSNYTLSVVVYALTMANSTRAQAALTLLNSRATVIANEGTKFWSTPSESVNFYWQPRTTDIETAAYALLSFQQQNRIADGIPVMKWLSQQRNQYGGYVSTQDTIMALQALSKFAAALPSNDTSLVVNVTGPSSFVPKTFQVNSNFQAMQSKQIEVSQPLSVNAIAVGYGLALVQLNIVYNRKPSSRRKRSTAAEAFQLDLQVKEDPSNIYELTLDVSMSYQGNGNETGMVIVQVGLLNGFQLHPKGVPITNTVELVEKKGNDVNLYLYALTRDTVTVSIPMVRSANVAGCQDAVVTVTEYYKPRNAVSRTYNSATMTKISFCDFCGLNCTQCRSNVKVKPHTSSANSPTFFILCILMVFLPYLFSL